MSSNDGNSRSVESGMVCEGGIRKQMEQNRAVDSPLGHLDPSKITHMVVDQVFPGGSAVHSGNDGFVVPGPPYQQWPRSSPVASPSVMSSPSKVMDGYGQPRMGTPTNLMHMQQGTIGSPTICNAPVTPQQMVQQQQAGMIQGQPTPTGQFDQSGGFNPQQMPQGYSQVVPESPGAVHAQQQMIIGGAVGQGDGSPGMYTRQQQQVVGQQQQQQQQQQMISQQQQMFGQQQPMMGHQVGLDSPV
ncbi:hypothetical protein GCK32_015006 [Trichostrongylus colubriformis]|uniref:Uncharacterized protein n=1 Tax=Trichostrongylus colubriformis TaxID=6319 RepID=A0AAN8FIJ4_TRICO